MNTTLDIALSNRDNYFSVIALSQSLNFDLVSFLVMLVSSNKIFHILAPQIVQRMVYTYCQKKDRSQWHLWSKGK